MKNINQENSNIIKYFFIFKSVFQLKAQISFATIVLKDAKAGLTIRQIRQSAYRAYDKKGAYGGL